MSRPQRFGAIPSHLLPDPLSSLTRSALLVYTALVCLGRGRAHVEGFEVTDGVLHWATRLDQRSLSRARRELVSHGLLQCRRQGHHAPTLYELVRPGADVENLWTPGARVDTDVYSEGAQGRQLCLPYYGLSEETDREEPPRRRRARRLVDKQGAGGTREVSAPRPNRPRNDPW